MTHPSLALLITQSATPTLTLTLGVLVYEHNPKRLVNRQFSALPPHLALWAFLVLTHGFDRNNGRNVFQKI